MPRRLLQIVSWVALAGIIVPPSLFLTGTISLEASKDWMLMATVLWFVVTPLWMGREPAETKVVI